MKRTLLAIVLALVPLLPATMAEPPTAHAEPCMPVGYGVALTVLTLGLASPLLFGCEPFGAADPNTGCPMGDVAAEVRWTAEGTRVDVHTFRLAQPCGDIKVEARYAYKGGEAAEELEGNGRKVRATWYCSSNPWIAGDQPPSCTRIAIAMVGDATGFDAGAASQATLPLSAGSLSKISRDTNRGQLGNALKANPRPGAQQAPPAPQPPVRTGPPIERTGSGRSSTNTTPARFPFQTVSQGAGGPKVEAIQYLLRDRGIDVAVDGDFGPQTRAAVIEFQRREGVTEDGVVRGATAAALLSKRVQQGDQGDAVLAVQTLLNAKGIEVVVDGDFGEQTAGAVRGFQENAGIDPADGVVDGETWRALMHEL
jgi:peptidoglycan hydrolase-like protein with peptidoglycan-binding domain